MYYKEFCPGGILKNYVQCYFVCENDNAGDVADKVFATGAVEIMFNLGTNGSQQLRNGDLVNQPDVQLWGQTIQPFSFTSAGKHAMLGVRFFTHTAACFFNEPIGLFNDQLIDFKHVGGSEAALLHLKLLDAKILTRQIELVEAFLLQRLVQFQHKFNKLPMVTSVMHDLMKNDFFENINSYASLYGISSRYLQKIFINYCGLSPNLFRKISRFQKSVQLVARRDSPLTAIAYECGYYDQSHFIKDFKFFTGSTPSGFSMESSTDLFAVLNN